MKRILLVLGLMAVANLAGAALVGKLDLNPSDITPIGGRNFTDGFWVAGIKDPLWNLGDTTAGKTILNVGPVYAHGINGNNQSIGAFLGFPIGDLGMTVDKLLQLFSPQIVKSYADLPPWLQDVGNWTSLDVAPIYNLNPGFGYVKGGLFGIRNLYGYIGGSLKIPWGPGSTH